MLAGVIVGGATPHSLRALAVPSGATWNLSDDLATNAKGAHTSAFADAYGNAGVWSMLGSATTARTPGTYRELPVYEAAPCGGTSTGLPRWTTGSTGPETMINLTPATINGLACAPNVKLVPAVAHAHPGPSSSAIYAWKSPIAGTVSITGGMSDADCGGGNGVTWFIDLGSSNIASTFNDFATKSVNLISGHSSKVII